MSKRNLTTQIMLSISERWLDPERERPVLERYPLTAPILSHLGKAHTSLVSFQRASTETQEAVAAVQREQAAVDAEHDRKIRGVFGVLTGLAELAASEERARHYLDLRDRLLPEGLRAVQRSYMGQAGEIPLLKGRLDEKTRRALSEIQTPEGPLTVHVDAWMSAASKLSDLEGKRMDIVEASGDTRKADVQRARNEWIRVVNGLRANLLLDGATPEDTHRVFRYLDHEEGRADRRLPAEASTPAELPDTPPEEPQPCADTMEEAELDPPSGSG